MNEKQLADRLRDISNTSTEDVDYELKRLADELDPPKPGTVVVFSRGGYGIVTPDGIFCEHMGNYELIEWHELIADYKPARVPAPHEVVVKRPHTSVWPMTIDRTPPIRADLVWHFIDPEGRCFNQQTATHGSITRKDAERMEERDE